MRKLKNMLKANYVVEKSKIEVVTGTKGSGYLVQGGFYEVKAYHPIFGKDLFTSYLFINEKDAERHCNNLNKS